MHRLAPDARADLDDIAFYVATESGSLNIAERLISALTEGFYILSRYPNLGRARDDDLGAGRRSYLVRNYLIIYRLDGSGDVQILRVVHGRRDLEALLF